MKNNNSQRMLLIPECLYQRFRDNCEVVGFANVYVVRFLMKVYSEEKIELSKSNNAYFAGHGSKIKKISIQVSKEVNENFKTKAKNSKLPVSYIVRSLLLVFINAVESRDMNNLSVFKDFVEGFETKKWWL